MAVKRALLVLFFSVIILKVGLGDVWDERRLDRLVGELAPGDVVEPRVLHHLRDVLVTLVRIALQHPHQQVLGLVADEGLVENEVVFQDFLKHPLVIVIVEWWQAGEHLIEKDTKAVDV